MKERFAQQPAESGKNDEFFLELARKLVIYNLNEDTGGKVTIEMLGADEYEKRIRQQFEMIKHLNPGSRFVRDVVDLVAGIEVSAKKPKIHPDAYKHAKRIESTIPNGDI